MPVTLSLRILDEEGRPPLTPEHPLSALLAAAAGRLTAEPRWPGLCGNVDAEAIVLLCDSRSFSLWSGGGDVLGVLAVTLGPLFDRDDAEHDDCSGFNRKPMIALDADRLMTSAVEEWREGESAFDAVARACVDTLAHESVHLAEMLRLSGGAAPHDVYSDGENGEFDVLRLVTCEGTELDPFPDEDVDPDERENANEERVERLGRELGDAIGLAGFDPDAIIEAFIDEIERREPISKLTDQGK
jgi:hypothetical protein